jgi:hypothetical protein
VALLGCLAAAPATAHKTNLTVGKIVVDGAELRYRLGVSAHDLAVVLDIPTDLVAPIPAGRFVERRDLLIEYLDEKLAVIADGHRCPRISLDIRTDKLPDEVVLDLVFRCPASPRQLHIAYRLFFGVDPGHRALGTIDAGGGPEEYLLDRAFADIEVDVAAPGRSLAAFGRLVVLGIEHILAGLDHVLFVVALLLGGGSFLALVRIVTAFTFAHSLTLSLAWFGLLDLPSRPVEILIAASVAYVAVENAVGRGFSHRWLVAFAFGLVHGLGFFGVLREIEIGRSDAVTTLLGFNLGVEIGQLVIVAVVYPLVIWIMAQRWSRRVTVSGSLAILALALMWIVERAFLA